MIIKKTIFCLFTSVILFSNKCISQDSLVLKKILNNKIQFFIPKSFREVSNDSIAIEYPNPQRRPSIIMRNEFTSIKVILLPEAVSNNEIASYKYFHAKNMKLDSNIKYVGEGVKNINEKKIGFIKAFYKAENTFAYLILFSFQGKAVLLTYNCYYTLWPALEELVEKIVNSIKIEE